MDSQAVTLPRSAELEGERFLYGLIAEFEHADEIVRAARRAHERCLRAWQERVAWFSVDPSLLWKRRRVKWD